jgi:hypothetical protein
MAEMIMEPFAKRTTIPARDGTEWLDRSSSIALAIEFVDSEPTFSTGTLQKAVSGFATGSMWRVRNCLSFHNLDPI